MTRLFVGIELPRELRAALALMGNGLPGARWTPEENYHLTLRFIGEVDNATFDDIAQSLGSIEAPAFELILKGVGHFGSSRQPRVLWVGVEPVPALLHLREKVESMLVRLGLEPEGRKYTPHITLARLDDAKQHRVADFEARHNLFSWPPIEARDFVLFSSRPGGGHAVYRDEARYPLIEGGATV
ncbi:MAG: RNA 2',3'-cyclic phosphodiesterase [Alphaproteobacteria bacterium]|nr:RNA 2',3'-cyclic phosphodiesterase [Alphaproteobacteria bacterium]